MKLTNQQILEIITQINEEIALKLKQMEVLSSNIEQAHLAHLSELKRTEIKVDNSEVNQSIEVYRNVVENASKTLDKKQKGFNWVLYCAGFCLISLLALFFAFKVGFQMKSEIRNEFYNELNNENRILSKDDALFIQKLRVWKNKNPKDSDKFFREIEKIKVN